MVPVEGAGLQGSARGVREDRIAVLDWGAYSPVGQDSGAERRLEDPPGGDPSLTAAVRKRNTERQGSLIAPASAHTPPPAPPARRPKPARRRRPPAWLPSSQRRRPAALAGAPALRGAFARCPTASPGGPRVSGPPGSLAPS